MNRLERFLKLALLFHKNNDQSSLNILNVQFNSFIKKHGHFEPHNDPNLPNPWKRNMDYAEYENSPYYGSISEFMKKFPGGIKDWIEWRKKTKDDRNSIYDINPKKVKKAEMKIKFEKEYEPTEEDIEEASRKPTEKELILSNKMVEKMLNELLRDGVISKEDIEEWKRSQPLKIEQKKEKQEEDSSCPICDDTHPIESEYGEWPSCPGCGTNADDNKEEEYKVGDVVQLIEDRWFTDLLPNDLQVGLIKRIKPHKNRTFYILEPVVQVLPGEEEKKEQWAYNRYSEGITFNSRHIPSYLISKKLDNKEMKEKNLITYDDLLKRALLKTKEFRNPFLDCDDDDGNEMREELADLEHEQWMKWAKDIIKSEDISKDRKERWEKECFKPYSKLSNEMKDFDREWADKVIKIFNKYNKVEKKAHYEPVGGDDVDKFEKEQPLYSNMGLEKFKSIKEFLKQYRGDGQSADDAALKAAKDMVNYWKLLLKSKKRRKGAK